jgi:IMP dehydrogenase
VGAAVGVHDFERAERLISTGVDVLTVDSAHGHSKNVVETVQQIKRQWSIDVIAGNVATEEGAKALIDAGADGIKVGIGPGSICTTRVVSGVGIPQLTAIVNAAKAVAQTNVPIIADGGIRYSGDITKAIAAGAHTVMLGGLLAGLESQIEEDPRGSPKLVPEGVEGRVPYKGPLNTLLYQLVGGLRAGMGYLGVRNIEELRTRSKFLRVSAATVRENHPHDIAITQESPNYTTEYAPVEGF